MKKRRASLLGLLASGLLFGLPHGVTAEDEVDSLIGLLEDESREDSDGEVDSEPLPTERRWQVSGSLELAFAADFDDDVAEEYEGLSKLRTEGRLRLDWSLPARWKLRLGGRGWYDAAYTVRGRSRYRDSVLDDYETELEFWESWIGGPVGERLDLRLGRQITSLGTSETLRVVDLLFPIDNREPGVADLDDLLLPVALVRADVGIVPGWSVLGLAFLERRFSELPPTGSSWLPPDVHVPGVDDPGHGLRNAEGALVLRGRPAGVDVSLIGAWFHANEPSWRLDPTAPEGLTRERDRLGMLAVTAVGAWRDWVFRGELAGFHGLEFANDPGERHDRFDLLAGIDWFGLSGSAIALDIVQRWLPSAPKSIEDAPDFTRRHRAEWALRWRHDLMRDRVHLTLVGIGLGWDLDGGAILRLQADWEWTDALALTVGVLLYASGDLPPASVLGQNDRFVASATWRF